MPGSGSKIFAADTPAAVQAADSTDELGFTSTTYTAGTVTVGVSFTAPTSGTVLVWWGARVEANTASRSVLVSVEVREGATVGAGTVVSAASDDSAIESPQDAAAGAATRLQVSRHRLVTGLTAGMPYTVRTMHKISASGNGDVFARDVAVLPSVS